MIYNSIKEKISNLYEGDSASSHRFRYALLGLDAVTIIYLVVSTFFHGGSALEMLDIVFGVYIATDYVFRMWISDRKLNFVIHPLNLADFIAMVSFVAPLLEGNFGFLRGVRVLRLLRSYRLQDKLRQDFKFFKQNQDVIISASNLFIFIFIMTEIVFVTQVGHNPSVVNFIDAMYFTIATLTTTGFGDVTLDGQTGHILSIIIMIFGVSLFLRLVQTMFRPTKVHYACPTCGLILHENDAVHCKHCGDVLNIPTEGVN